jgi:hypothetical protein
MPPRLRREIQRDSNSGKSEDRLNNRPTVREEASMKSKISKRDILRGGLAAAGFAIALSASPVAIAQESIKLTMAAGHPPIFLWVNHLKETLMTTVDAELAKTGK